MKAKHFKKIRKMHKYSIALTGEPFGAPYYETGITVIAKNPEHAILRFERAYARKHRYYSPFHRDNNVYWNSNVKWGFIRVHDLNANFYHFFR